VTALKKPVHPSWAFHLDHVHPWAFCKNAITTEECKKIIEIGNSIQEQKGVVYGNNADIRCSDISWIYPSKDTEWLYRCITDIVLSLNNDFFKFDLFGLLEGLQFTKYSSPGGKYNRHIDSLHNTPVRKLSFSLQLSDEKEYSGGDLCLHLNSNKVTAPRPQGTFFAFPSYVLHEVEPVTCGTRYSLVGWATGAPFR